MDHEIHFASPDIIVDPGTGMQTTNSQPIIGQLHPFSC
jgi:hypothetical protein